MKAGDRVRKDKVMKVIDAIGTIEKVNNDYVVVIWDKVNGHWHYTHAQAIGLEVISEGG